MLYRCSWALWAGICRYSSVSLVTHYRLNGPGIETSLGEEISLPALTSADPHPSPCAELYPLWVYRVIYGGKRIWEWCWVLTIFSADVKEIVEVHLYPSCGPSMIVIGRNLYFLSVEWETGWNQILSGSSEEGNFLFIPMRMEPCFLGGPDYSLDTALSQLIYLTPRRSLSLDSVFYVIITSNKATCGTRVFPCTTISSCQFSCLPACHIHLSIISKL